MPDSITNVAVYPPIGIARVGNAPTDYYIASDVPGRAAEVEGGYKDAKGRIKKQVVRFRIYGLNDDGEVVRELTAADATIEWRVHVANRKAAWYQFLNALDLPGLGIPSAFRNASESDRSQLVIDPGSRSISGKNRSGPEYRFDGGTFYGKEVPLGELRTDEKGRLLFFGGDGHSASRTGAPATTFANNDGWHDDVSDGPVRATVKYKGKTLEAEPALAVVTPPNFGQGLFSPVSMYDVVLDLYVREGWMNAPATPDFHEHIYPILERTVQTQWVNAGFNVLFGANSPSDFTDPDYLKKLSDPSTRFRRERRRVFEWFRNPASKEYRPAEIPPFYGDAFGDYKGLPNVGLYVTATQYGWLEQWAEGNFTTAKPRAQKAFDDMAPEEQVASLTAAPLMECLGGPFHPGIEITWPLRNLILWEKPFRPKILPEGEQTRDNYGPLLAPEIALAAGGPLDGSGPGSMTRWLGVPWQTDEASCLSGYDPSTYLPLPSFWAARVPNQILSEESYKRLTYKRLNLGQRLKHFDYRQDWLRDLGTQYTTRINNMVAEWHELGIVGRQEAPTNKGTEYLPVTLWVELDRGPFIKDDPTFRQVLRAENADEKHLMKAEALLAETTGPEAPDRPERERPLFARDEF